MKTIAIYGSRIFTPQDEISDGVIVVQDSRIAAVGHRDEVHVPPGAEDYIANDALVVPGFVDLHIHGAGGHDVMEATESALDRITTVVARYGTTSIVATTVSAPVDITCKSLEGIAAYIRNHEAAADKHRFGAEILGIHLEGPFLAAAKRGVHPPSALVPPSRETLAQFRKAANGLVRMLTIAPELPGALEVIEAAAGGGIVVGMGHTDANYDQARAAIDAGAKHAVHMYNAMRPFTHRDPGVIGAVLTDPDVTAEVIADGVHVAEAALQVLFGCKGFETVLLVSDGIAATGMRDGKYTLGNFEVEVTGGVCRNSEGKLAGSTLTLDQALRHVVEIGVALPDAIRMVTLLPARRLGIAGRKGVIAPGADADIVMLTPDLHVAGVMTRGILQ